MRKTHPDRIDALIAKPCLVRDEPKELVRLLRALAEETGPAAQPRIQAAYDVGHLSLRQAKMIWHRTRGMQDSHTPIPTGRPGRQWYNAG